jgi:hypothetical protein
MKIVNYKKFNEISPTSKCMIFCTCAESNQKHYLDKIKIWFERYKNFNADFYIFNDGKILGENYNFDLDTSITVIEFDESYGRPAVGSCCFPGWKRSFAYAMELSLKYDYVCHIENDVFIKDLEAFKTVLYTNDVISSTLCSNYNWIESSILILNNKSIREKLFNHFKEHNVIYGNNIFEFELQTQLNGYTKYGGSLRLEREIDLRNMHSDRYCVLNQCSIEQLIELHNIYCPK